MGPRESSYQTSIVEKPHGIKNRIREQRKRNRRVTLAIIMMAVVSFSGLITYSVLNQSSPSQPVSFKAVIVDQLSGTFPNPSFEDTAKTMLVDAGYTVDYYGPDQVTVDFFRTLPSKGYGIVIIRAHSTGWVPGDKTAIFTSETWSINKYVYEQLVDEINGATLAGGKHYFTILPKFVSDAMQGQFPHSVVIMMGCTGLKDSEMARAFVSKGARVYVSWENSVTPDRTDSTTISLLRSMAQGKTISEAVSAAMNQVGPDPVYNSTLGFYPDDQAALVLSLQHNAMTTSLRARWAV